MAKMKTGRGEALQREVRLGWSKTVVMQAVMFLLITLFFLTFFNRFVGVRSGTGEFSGGIFYLMGKLPYRDAYSAAPPLNMIKSALLLHLFGQELIVSRIFGVVARLVMAGVLFQWLRQMFPPVECLIATVVTIILSAGDRTDPVASYNHDTILWGMLCGVAASIVLAEERRSRTILWSVFSGICASMCLMSKQTIGLGVLTSVLVVTAVLLYEIHGFRRAAEWIPAFIVGVMVPISALVAYLHHMQLLEAFLQMLFVQGPKAKGGNPGEFLIREFNVARGNYKTALLGFFLFALSLPAIRIWQKSSERNEEKRNYLLPALCVLMAGIAVIGVGYAMAEMGIPARRNFTKTAVYFTFVGLTVLLAFQVIPVLLGKMDLKRARVHSVLHGVMVNGFYAVALVAGVRSDAVAGAWISARGYAQRSAPVREAIHLRSPDLHGLCAGKGKAGPAISFR